ncbi:hypothetical protein GGI07_002802 [Coemansia sp. Benny D115]|nr:hypothetical protein GGI07_002802 [Coemansia sp. Benny D115]
MFTTQAIARNLRVWAQTCPTTGGSMLLATARISALPRSPARHTAGMQMPLFSQLATSCATGLLKQQQQQQQWQVLSPAATRSSIRNLTTGAFQRRNGSGRGNANVVLFARQRASVVFVQPAVRGQQVRGARWERYTKANYGSNRGNSYRNQGRGQHQQRFFDNVSPEKLVYTIIGLNAVVLVVWQVGNGWIKSFGDYSLVNWMVKNFTISWANLMSGRLWTLLTPAFSHIEPLHFAINMFMLYSFGVDLVRMLGPRRFMAFYLGAALCGNLTSAVIRGVVMPIAKQDYSQIAQPSLGASTSVVGITTLMACLQPHAQIMLFMVIPMPFWVATVGFIGYDLYNTSLNKRGRADGAGHLGGAAAGLAYYWFRLRPLIRRMR